MQHAKRQPQFVILLLLVTFGSVAAVLFTPALPSIQSFFGRSVGETQLTVTIYLIGYALGQLPYGPLANRFGRKRTLYMGISLSIFGSLLSAFSAPLHSFPLLVAARFLQALGACVGLKISFTMVGDSYNQTDATRIISRMVIAFAVMPGVGTAIGGWLTQLLNWESCFYFLALYGAIILWLSSRLPETAKSIDAQALTLPSIIQGYKETLKNKRLLICASMMGCGTAIVYVFASKSPFIGIKLIGMNPEVFGSYNLIPSVGMLLGSFLASRLVGRFPFFHLLLIGISGSFVATLSMLVPFALGTLNQWLLFLPMFFIYASESIVYANVSSFGMTTAKNKSNASAILNFINMSTAFFAVLLSELIFPESALLMPVSFFFFFLLMFFFWFRLKKLRRIA